MSHDLLLALALWSFVIENRPKIEIDTLKAKIDQKSCMVCLKFDFFKPCYPLTVQAEHRGTEITNNGPKNADKL